LQKPVGFQTLLAWIGRIEQSFKAAGSDLGPIHGENALSNVMLGQGGATRLVDFDRATNADPHYDLAGFCLEFCSFYDQVDETVALYLGAPDSKVSARTALYMIVDDFLWGCWSLIEHYSSHRNTTIEFYKYALNRFFRCRYWLNRWDIATLQRSM
jgi:thiamine kinase-like enzyme